MWAFYTFCNTVWPLALVSDLLLLLICIHLLSYLLVLAFEQVSGFLVIVKALFRCLFSEGLTLIDLSSWCEIVVEISFIFFMINILNFLLQYKMVGNIFLNEEIFSFYIFKKLLFSRSIRLKKVSESLHFRCLNQCHWKGIGYFQYEYFDVTFYYSFYSKMLFMDVTVLTKFEDFLSMWLETTIDLSY